MNKNQLVAAVSEESGTLNRAQALVAIEALTAVIARTTALGEKVTIPGFGTFGARDLAAQQRRNPATGEPVYVPATRKPTFKAGKNLAAAVAGEQPVAAAGA